MKVLQVINNLNIGGAEVLLKDLVLCMLQRGIDVSIALLNSTGSYLEQKYKEKKVCFLPMPKSSVYSPMQAFWLAKKLKNYDIVHVHLFPAQLWVALASMMSNRRPFLITTEHSTYNRRRKSWFRSIDSWMYKKYRFIACISDATTSALIKWIPGVAGKEILIPNGVNIERFRNAQAADKSRILKDNRRAIILSIGRFEPEKDHATLIRAMVNIPDAQLVLVGDGEMRQQLEQLAKSMRILDRVNFLGRRQDVPELIKMADIYVQSSLWEGFGIATLEAMAGGVPVIVSNVPGLSDVIKSAGLCFPPGDHEALSKSISLLLSSPDLRGELSQAGMDRASNYSIDRTVDLYLDLYRQCINNPAM